jgi:hypothetical protein
MWKSDLVWKSQYFASCIQLLKSFMPNIEGVDLLVERFCLEDSADFSMS